MDHCSPAVAVAVAAAAAAAAAAYQLLWLFCCDRALCGRCAAAGVNIFAARVNNFEGFDHYNFDRSQRG